MFAIRTCSDLRFNSHQIMRQGLLGLAVVVMGCLLLMPMDDVDAAEQVLSQVPAEVLPDEADLIPWSMSRYPRFAEDSVINVGPWLFDKPAGKHGHVQTQADGSIAFADGTPVRFWGTTLAFGASFPEKPKEIEVLADAIAAKGYNLVRFHHNDMNAKGLGFLQVNPKSNYLLEPSEMDRFDKFASELYKRGIYVYLDLIDYRDLLEEDGLNVPDFEKLKKINGKGWKGLFPHPAIVNAWKRFVTEFLNHVNPYTGNRWGDEPGVVTIEIINENGLFWDWSFKLTDSMTQWHNQQWNQWLVKRYGTREKLDKAWTDLEGTHGLFANEDPTKNTVFAPRLMAFTKWDRPHRSKTRGASRVNDYFNYLSETAADFYRDATQHIRSLGYKGLVLGSHELYGPANQYAEIQDGRVLAAHLYANGNTVFNARPGVTGGELEGVDLRVNNWFSNIPRVKAQGVAAVNGEWTGGTFTQRADVNMAVATISSYQNITQSLHFTLAHRWRGERMPDFDYTFRYIGYKKKISRSFSSLHDFPWMATNRIISPMFIRQDISRPKVKVHIACSAVDRMEQNLHAPGKANGTGSIGGLALFMPMIHDVNNYFFDEVYDGKADVVFTTGRSASGDYSNAKHAVILGDNPYNDPYHKSRDLAYPVRKIHPSVKVVKLDKPSTFSLTSPWEQDTTISFPTLEAAIDIKSIPAGSSPIGVSADKKYTLGWIDDRNVVFPNAGSFDKKTKDARWLLRLYLHAAKRWGIPTADNDVDNTWYTSDTGELTFDWGRGTLVVDTPKTQGFSGLMGWRENNKTDNLQCEIDVPYGNVLITSADNKPIDQSQRMILTAAGRMKNTGMEVGPNKAGKTVVLKAGQSPCFVEGLRGQLILKSNIASKLHVYALDSRGRRLGEVPVSRSGNNIKLELTPRWQTIWFEVATQGFDAPVNEKFAGFPTQVSSRSTQPPAAPLMDAQELFVRSAKSKVVDDTEVQQGDIRFTSADFSQTKFPFAYVNAKASKATDSDGKYSKITFGKVNQEWFGGCFADLTAPQTKPENCKGMILHFKGDGTQPRDAFLTLTCKDGLKYKSKQINYIFENDQWHDVLLTASDFKLQKKSAKGKTDVPESIDWSTVKRMDFGVVGPIMNSAAVGNFKRVEFLLDKPADNSSIAKDELLSMMPKVQKPKSSAIDLPLVLKGQIDIDGMPDDKLWAQAFGLAMDEDNVPDWHFFGSHVVFGSQLNEEGATFWMIATQKGLALLAHIDKGGLPIATENADWYKGDCLEVFSDVNNEGKKPTKQLFLAYSRPGSPFAAASDSNIQIARTPTDAGYLLEAMIPWHSLGFKSLPQSTFGLEFQVDFARPEIGKTLQMTYGTGTNEAWSSAAHYLKVTLKQQ
ncbi:MAG: hypothetical protein CMJ19_17845 [Phycisphaeraceae bacterium]|nr:hypothetical protein [Phycisphaeraceae bacterium]